MGKKLRKIGEDGFEALLSERAEVIVDFSADWCAPCRALAPVLAGLDDGTVTVVKVDVDEEPELARRFGVSSIPTVVRFSAGTERARSVGYATRDQLTSRLGIRASA